MEFPVTMAIVKFVIYVYIPPQTDTDTNLPLFGLGMVLHPFMCKQNQA